MWAEESNKSDVNWYQAKDYCTNLRLAGHSNWRLATIDELMGIYEPTQNVGYYRIKGSIDISGLIWSSSAGVSSQDIWAFAFANGLRHSFLRASSHPLRALCVRRP